MNPHLNYRFWGKTGIDGGYHPLPYHCLDVAACARSLLARLPHWRRRLERLCGLSQTELERWVPFFAALHDLGKFAASFQSLQPELYRSLNPNGRPLSYRLRHDAMGWLLWQSSIRDEFVKDGLAKPARPMRKDGLDRWLMAVTGHHGQPPLADPRDHLPRDLWDTDRDPQAAGRFARDAHALLTAGQPLPTLARDASERASWWLAGLTVLADWLGSNRDHFPFEPSPMPLRDYWDRACRQADEAVAAAGLLPSEPARAFALSDCFPETPAERLRATPLQNLAASLALNEGPNLIILEDVTGAGKTEAALLLTQRLMHTGHANGVYVGLPTMATANGMYHRLGTVYRGLFSADSRPSLALAHGRAELVSSFRDSILELPARPEADYRDHTTPAGAQCAAWLADGRKKALLADVGVGTVDQALLGVLPARHQSLRLLGLMDKVLVVDEVHACDDYMRRLLAELLKAQGRAGGSVILLSATLPRQQRLGLMTEFAKGAGWETPAPAEPGEDVYPLLTRLDHNGLQQHPVDTRESVRRRVEIETLDAFAEAEALLAATRSEGHCACWLRNTVGDALETWQRLKASHPDWEIELFHARFALADRLAIEDRVLAQFGPNSGPEQRRGRILIATQVVEQSLDLDFDTLITDLAPIDLLIQRAGRLRRHRRDPNGKRLGSDDLTDGRGAPRLHVFAPEWTDTPGANWVEDHLRGTSFVYPDHGRLWLGLGLLRESGGFAMPDDARRLIEGVYDEDSFNKIPAGLQKRTLDAEGAAKCDRGFAERKLLDLDRGYQATGSWLDEDSAPTRLGDPTVSLFLARREGEALHPLCSTAAEPHRAWMESSLSVRRALADAEVRPEGIDDEHWERWKADLPSKGRWGLLLVMEPENSHWSGELIDQEERRRKTEYDPQAGLRIERN